jgi:hypothetical protein
MIAALPSTTATVTRFSMPGLLLRLEGLTAFLAAVILYAHLGFSGLAFVLLLLTPDLAMIGYKVNPRIGAMLYNLAHLYTLPALLLAAGLALNTPILLQAGLIWMAHIGMDRGVGYGFKYATAFKDTHLTRV